MGFLTLFVAALAALALLVAAALVLPAPWSWSIGLAYIVYDTWLLGYHLRTSLIAASRDADPLPSAGLPDLTVLVAAHDEGRVLGACIDAIGGGPGVAVTVIDDGSEDGSGEALAARHGLSWSDGPASGVRVASATGSWLTVIRQPRGGKASALNRGLALTSSELVVTIDADTVLEPGALTSVRSAFAQDAGLAAACGVLTPVCTGGAFATAFAFFQRREYDRAFFWRVGWSASHSLVLVSGAFAAYRRPLLSAAGGFDERSLVEDYELMFRLHDRHGGVHARVLRGARARTDAPGGPLPFLRQRSRWFAGFLATMWQYRRLVGDRRLGHLGRWHLRLKTLDTLLPLYGLLAAVALLALWWRHGGLAPLVLWLLAGKALLDAALHAWAQVAYRRWLGQPTGVLAIGGSLLASLAEQVCFQPLRQLGAALGWIMLLRRARHWRSERGRR